MNVMTSTGSDPAHPQATPAGDRQTCRRLRTAPVHFQAGLEIERQGFAVVGRRIATRLSVGSDLPASTDDKFPSMSGCRSATRMMGTAEQVVADRCQRQPKEARERYGRDPEGRASKQGCDDDSHLVANSRGTPARSVRAVSPRQLLEHVAPRPSSSWATS